MNLKSIMTTAGLALLFSLSSSSAKAQDCQFIMVTELYSGCYLRITTCGSSTIGSGCSSGGQSAAKKAGPPKTSNCEPAKELAHPALKPAVSTEPKETE
jgi:hypothetical protein